jgi:hypothetical protein
LDIQGFDESNLHKGDYIIVLLDTECEHCQEEVERINLFTDDEDLPEIIGLCKNDESLRIQFIETFQPLFRLGQIGEDAFWRLLGEGDIPRTFFVSDGRILDIWDEIVPDADQLKVLASR